MGYAILKDGTLAGWAEDEAAYGVNLLLGQVDADVVEVPVPGGESAALRVVGARTRVRPRFQAGELTGLEILCRVDANLAGGNADLEDPAVRTALEDGLSGTGGSSRPSGRSGRSWTGPWRSGPRCGGAMTREPSFIYYI